MADTVTGVEVPIPVAKLLAVLPDDWAETVGLQGKAGRCIEATLVAVTALRKVGVECKGLACDVIAVNAAAKDLVRAGQIQAGLWPPEAWSVGVTCDRETSGANSGSSDCLQAGVRRQRATSGRHRHDSRPPPSSSKSMLEPPGIACHDEVAAEAFASVGLVEVAPTTREQDPGMTKAQVPGGLTRLQAAARLGVTPRGGPYSRGLRLHAARPSSHGLRFGSDARTRPRVTSADYVRTHPTWPAREASER